MNKRIPIIILLLVLLFVPSAFAEETTVPKRVDSTRDTDREYFQHYIEAYKSISQPKGGKEVPIVLYHSIAPGGGDDFCTPEKFEQFLLEIKRLGYETVSFADLYSYTGGWAELPEKPLVITFDDGYRDNMEYAYPLLKKHGMRATVFLIGCSVGKDTYKDTGEAMTPHFDWEEAREMEEAGVIEIESHGYDIHEVPGRDKEPVRQGILKREEESESEYVKFLCRDVLTMKQLFSENLGKEPTVLSYPYGLHTNITDAVLKELGFHSLLTLSEKTNVIVKGNPYSMLLLGRYSMDTQPFEAVINKITGRDKDGSQ